MLQCCLEANSEERSAAVPLLSFFRQRASRRESSRALRLLRDASVHDAVSVVHSGKGNLGAVGRENWKTFVSAGGELLRFAAFAWHTPQIAALAEHNRGLAECRLLRQQRLLFRRACHVSYQDQQRSKPPPMASTPVSSSFVRSGFREVSKTR